MPDNNKPIVLTPEILKRISESRIKIGPAMNVNTKGPQEEDQQVLRSPASIPSPMDEPVNTMKPEESNARLEAVRNYTKKLPQFEYNPEAGDTSKEDYQAAENFMGRNSGGATSDEDKQTLAEMLNDPNLSEDDRRALLGPRENASQGEVEDYQKRAGNVWDAYQQDQPQQTLSKEELQAEIEKSARFNNLKNMINNK